MICNIVLYYTLIFFDGTFDHRKRHLDEKITKRVTALFTDYKYLKQFKIKEVIHVKVEKVPEFLCSEEPSYDLGEQK